jgi:hypothetical protein
MRKNNQSEPRWLSACHWIQAWCVNPNGPHKGTPARLSLEQRDLIRIVFEFGNAPPPDDRPLCAYLALLSLCGPPPLRDGLVSPSIDPWTAWEAAGEQMRTSLVRHGDKILCPELGRSFQAAA